MTGARRRSRPSEADLASALQPLLDRIGGRLVESGHAAAADVVVRLPGGPTVHVRLDAATASASEPTADPSADLSDGLARLIAGVERELGARLADLPRAGKQRAVRLLEERGAFEMRRSAETVAEALGVTRFTVYNYLNRQTSA